MEALNNNALEGYQQEIREALKKAKKYNNFGIPFAVLMLFPGLHYIGMVGVCFFAIQVFEHSKKAEYYRGLIDGCRGVDWKRL